MPNIAPIFRKSKPLPGADPLRIVRQRRGKPRHGGGIAQAALAQTLGAENLLTFRRAKVAAEQFRAARRAEFCAESVEQRA